MSDHFILNSQGDVEATDLMTWARWFETADRVVAKTRIGDDAEVSTIFLGLDHSFGSGPPLIFETMVFGGPLDQEQERYSTRAEAEAGHAALVERASGTSS
jgi:hypothetical protein